ncbi:MAG: PH domain-containing protein [Candidatus Thorarchaeota archaeon]|nr:PH domain-containing protein [Candidatus Thorarchaeota archaeon]
MTSTTPVPFPPEKRERLVAILYPKRIGFLWAYVVGVIVFMVGFLSNVAASAGWIIHNELSWDISIIGLVAGALIVSEAETRRRSTLYIITTWNVRVRTGLLRKRTVRLFYDQIKEIRLQVDPQRRRISIGDLQFYSQAGGDTPVLVFRDVYSPDGIKELITRFIETTPSTPPWAHVPR